MQDISSSASWPFSLVSRALFPPATRLPSHFRFTRHPQPSVPSLVLGGLHPDLARALPAWIGGPGEVNNRGGLAARHPCCCFSACSPGNGARQWRQGHPVQGWSDAVRHQLACSQLAATFALVSSPHNTAPVPSIERGAGTRRAEAELSLPFPSHFSLFFIPLLHPSTSAILHLTTSRPLDLLVPTLQRPASR